MPVPTFYRALNLPRPKPNAQIEVKDRKIIESHVAVPSAEDIHILMVNYSTVAESDLGFCQEIQVGRNEVLSEQRAMVLRILIDEFDWHGLPTVCADLVLVDIGEYMSLIPASINVEVVEVADEGVVGAGLRRILWIQVSPLVLESLVLSQVVEVVATFASVAAEKENTVFESQTVGARSRGRNLVLVFTFGLNLPPEIRF